MAVTLHLAPPFSYTHSIRSRAPPRDNMRKNILLNTDSYKTSHYTMYPPGCEALSCYIESRGGPFERSLFFGLQAFLLEYLSNPITQQDIDEADLLLKPHGLPFNRAGWQYILEKHSGYLPVEIEAVAEGTFVPTHHVMLQIKNTDPNCFWLPTYLETAMLRAVWYPTTVATLSSHCRETLKYFLEQTADTCDALPFQLHDFGARGVSSYESSALGGMAHLVNFQGTDTLAAILAAKRYYNEPMAGHSIPAAEHSTIISWGKDHEKEAYECALENYAGDGKVLSIVCDSYDIWHALTDIFGKDLKESVSNNTGRLVVRPDSGNPEEVVLRVIETLIDIFGHTTNSKGFRVLPDNLRVIQGDGVNIDSIKTCLEILKAHSISAENVVFGMGGALLQRIHRDTAKFAMKASCAKINGVWQDIKKQPITDLGKTSRAGRLALVEGASGQLETIPEHELGDRNNKLRPVYRNGKLLINDDFSAIRARATRDTKQAEAIK